MRRFYLWMEANPITVALSALSIGAALIAGFTLADEQQRLGGVESAGPCREKGPDDPECQRQARLIIQSCAAQPACREILRLVLVRVDTEGVAGSSGDSPSSRPSPGRPGPQGKRGPAGPKGEDAPDRVPQPPQPSPPGLIDGLKDTGCKNAPLVCGL